MKSPRNLLSQAFDIHRHELRRVLLMSAYLSLVIASYATAKAVRDSLFVTNIGPAQLPYMYLGIAGAMGLISYVYSQAVNRIGLHRLIRATSLFAIANLLVFWVVFPSQSPHWFYVLYIWVSLFGAITASQFWLLATHVFNPREARRVFAWLAVGGILGGIAGGATTNILARGWGTESLIVVCAVMIGITVIILSRIAGDEVEEEAAAAGEKQNEATPLSQILQSRHLTMMTLLLVVAVIVQAFIDYEYKSIANRAFDSKDELTAFFGSITFYTGILALLFQLILTTKILKRFGVGPAILLLPAGLFAASVTLTVHPVLWSAALLQLIDGALSHSIHRSSTELLYLPIPPQTRNAVKGFIDMFVDRFGRAIGGLLLLGLTTGFALSIPELSMIVSVLAAIWIVAALVIRREYLQSFRAALEKKSIEPEVLQARVLDGASVRALLKTLSSGDERQVLYAIDLLANTPPSRWRRQIQELIRHPSSAVRARAIAVLAQWNDPSLTKDQFINHPDYRTARIALASALRIHWTGAGRPARLLEELLSDADPEVCRQAIRTAGLVKHAPAVPQLIEKLADKSLRNDACDGLLQFGHNVVPELVRRLSNPQEPWAVRRRIPKTLALTGKQRAADALMECLHRFDYDLDYWVMKALNRMRVNEPGIAVSSDAVAQAIQRERAEYEHLRSVRLWFEANPGGAPLFVLLHRTVRERLEDRVERIFRLTALVYSPHDIYSVYYNCKVRPALRPSALEFLDNILDSEFKHVIQLVEQVFDNDAGNAADSVEFISLDAVIETLVSGRDPWLKTMALYLRERLDPSQFGVERELPRRSAG